MATTIILIRHAVHELVDRVLVGRRPDVCLSPAGIEQSRRLVARLTGYGLHRVKSSPRYRALQTARFLAQLTAKGVNIAMEFDEIEFGTWTGRTFESLARDARWRRWNSRRGSCRPPGGESMRELQARVLRGLTRIAAAHPGERVAIVTHAEPIRAAVLHYRGMALDEFFKVPIEPVSLTILQLDGRCGSVLQGNDCANGALAAA